MYTNIPLNILTNIIRNTLSKEEFPQVIIYEIDRITRLVLEQNYFQHNKIFYKQKGLAMGAPSSSILSEIFLQFMEHDILKILIEHKVISYSRYVDDILIIYDHTKTNLNQVLNDFNNIHNMIQYTIKKENNNEINFLDISIHRLQSSLEYKIYPKPTSTSTIIHNTSCHPVEQKVMAFNFLFNRLNLYPLNNINKNNKLQIINQIAKENEYQPTSMILKFKANNKPNSPHTTHTTQEIPENKKWAIFTYVGRETRYTTKFFRNTNIKTAFKTINNLKKHLFPNQVTTDKYEKPGVYKLKCMDCTRQYIGQTGRSFKTKYKEHIRHIHNKRETSGYVQHILEAEHAFGKMSDIMEVIKIERKGSHLIHWRIFTYLNHSNKEIN
jgi:hypothetical protein